MSAFNEFYEMAQEMLSDPETRSEAVIEVSIIDAPADKPWAAGRGLLTEHPVFCFYYKAKNSTVNGTVIQTGQQVALVQTSLPEATLQSAIWVDKAGKRWVIKTTEAVQIADQTVYTKVLLGA